MTVIILETPQSTFWNIPDYHPSVTHSHAQTVDVLGSAALGGSAWS